VSKAANKGGAAPSPKPYVWFRAVGKERKLDFVEGTQIQAYGQQAGIQPADGEFYWAGAERVDPDYVVRSPGSNLSVGKKAVNGCS
jgi:hypothetical protein